MPQKPPFNVDMPSIYGQRQRDIFRGHFFVKKMSPFSREVRVKRHCEKYMCLKFCFFLCDGIMMLFGTVKLLYLFGVLGEGDGVVRMMFFIITITLIFR